MTSHRAAVHRPPTPPKRHPYPSYRNSGVEWLGEVPEHWEVNRLEHLASYRTSSVDKKTIDHELPVRLCNYTDVYYRDRIRASAADFMSASASKQEIARFKLNVGDVLITKDSEDWTDIAVPALMEEAADDFVCGYHLGIIRPLPTTVPAFVFWAMQSVAVNRQLQISASGVTRYGVSNSAVNEVLMPRPPLNEQRSIAAFLDRETAKIDSLVAKKRLLLERLAEYRTALITRTVTKGLPHDAAKQAGLNPNPPLKPSGVEWLGEVPEHWAVKQIRYICQFGYGDSLHSEVRQPGGTPVCGSNGVVGDHNAPNTLAPVIVIGRKGSHGKVNFYHECVFAIDTTYFVDNRHTSANLRWLYFALPCTDLAEDSLDSAVPGLSREHAYRKHLAVPPLTEQLAIAAFLDKQTRRINALSLQVMSAIERLQEYRTALITAAVTGQIDVRDSEMVETGASA